MTNDPPVWFGLAGRGNCLSQTLDPALGIGTYSIGFGEGAGGKYHIGHCSCFGEEDVDDHQVIEAFERVFAVVAVWVGDESVFAVDEHGKNLLAAEIERLDLGNSLFCIHFAPIERFELRFAGGIVDRLEAGVIGRNCADIARALDIVLTAHRVDTGALTAEIAGHHGEVTQALHVVDTTDVFSDTQRIVDCSFIGGAVETSGLLDIGRGHFGDRRGPFRGEFDDVFEEFFALGGAFLQKSVVDQIIADDHMGHRQEQCHVGPDADRQIEIGHLR